MSNGSKGRTARYLRPSLIFRPLGKIPRDLQPRLPGAAPGQNNRVSLNSFHPVFAPLIFFFREVRQHVTQGPRPPRQSIHPFGSVLPLGFEKKGRWMRKHVLGRHVPRPPPFPWLQGARIRPRRAATFARASPILLPSRHQRGETSGRSTRRIRGGKSSIRLSYPSRSPLSPRPRKQNSHPQRTRPPFYFLPVRQVPQQGSSNRLHDRPSSSFGDLLPHRPPLEKFSTPNAEGQRVEADWPKAPRRPLSTSSSFHLPFSRCR